MTLSAKIAIINKAKTKYLYFGLAKNLLFRNIAGIQSTKIKNGITIIPNQIAQNDNGEYLYFQNKVWTILDDEEEEEKNKNLKVCQKELNDC